MSGPHEDGPDDELARRREEARGPVDRFVGPLFSDSTLWPVLLVMLAVMATFFGSVILMALRTRSLAATAALLGLAWLTVAPVRADWARRRVGPTTVLLLLVWGLSIALAVVGAWTGVI